MAAVAANILRAMRDRDTNPAELARAARLNPTGVYDILSGKSSNPRLDTLEKIASALSLSIVELFSEPPEPDMDQEIRRLWLSLSTDDRRRFLAVARALLPDSNSA